MLMMMLRVILLCNKHALSRALCPSSSSRDLFGDGTHARSEFRTNGYDQHSDRRDLQTPEQHNGPFKSGGTFFEATCSTFKAQSPSHSSCARHKAHIASHIHTMAAMAQRLELCNGCTPVGTSSALLNSNGTRSLVPGD